MKVSTAQVTILQKLITGRALRRFYMMGYGEKVLCTSGVGSGGGQTVSRSTFAVLLKKGMLSFQLQGDGGDNFSKYYIISEKGREALALVAA